MIYCVSNILIKKEVIPLIGLPGRRVEVEWKVMVRVLRSRAEGFYGFSSTLLFATSWPSQATARHGPMAPRQNTNNQAPGGWGDGKKEGRSSKAFF